MDGAVAGLILVGVLVVFAAIVVAKSVALIPQAEAAVIERLGRYSKTVSGQLTLLLPFVDRIRARVDLRERVVSFPPQPVITEDNLTVNIDTVVYFQVTNPQAAVYQISNYIVGVEQLTTTTLRNVVGGMTLEQTLTSRDQINGQLRGVLDEATGRWGLRVARVELRSIDPPPSIQDSMEKQMRADREKRAMILTAEGSREAAIKQAEGQKQAQILSAEGAKQAAILAAEADRQSRMLRAQGERAASYLQAQGQAKAIEKTFAAIKAGRPTPEMLAYQYLQTLPQMAKGEANKVWLVPSDFGCRAAGLHQDARRAGRGRRLPVHAVAGGGEPAQARGRLRRGGRVVHHADGSRDRSGRRQGRGGRAFLVGHQCHPGRTGGSAAADAVPAAVTAAAGRSAAVAGSSQRLAASPSTTVVARVGADLVDQARDAETRGEQRHQDQQRADVVGERVAEDDDRGGAGQQAGQCRPCVRQHPHGGGARGVVEHRERDGRDQPHRHHRRPAALAQPGVEGLDPRMGDEAVEPPAGGADQQQREQCADRAGDDRDGDAEPGAEQEGPRPA